MPNLLTMNYTPAAARFLSRMQGYAEAVRVGGDKATRDQMTSVRTIIVASTPVDTGNLQKSWSPVESRGPLQWGIWTNVAYAPTLEYGGYPRPGPKTVRLAGGSLGAGFTAGPGVYSRQAPLGFVRRALANAREDYLLRVRNVVRNAWGKGGTGPAFPTARMDLGRSELESLFGIPIVTTVGEL